MGLSNVPIAIRLIFASGACASEVSVTAIVLSQEEKKQSQELVRRRRSPRGESLILHFHQRRELLPGQPAALKLVEQSFLPLPWRSHSAHYIALEQFFRQRRIGHTTSAMTPTFPYA